MIPEPQRTYVLELIAALGPAANDFILAGAQAMKFTVTGARATKDVDFLLNVIALRDEPLQLAGNDSSTAWFERGNAGDASEPSTSCCGKPPSTPIPTVNNPIRQKLRPVWPGAEKKRASQRLSGGRKCLHTEPASPHRRWAKLDSTSLPASMDSERRAERIEIHRMTGQYQKCSQWDSFSAACYRTIFE